MNQQEFNKWQEEMNRIKDNEEEIDQDKTVEDLKNMFGMKDDL